ncbi:MAG: hypothetical protein WBG53_00755 [Rhodococcus sp. (in: high G+C Gram-positive bacteria)]|uniref:hypothetical protein n=1 Tax=Rhodococcus sp. BS-15 TaxID=1304954 RepID=UPI000FFC18B2|nr:hypothetical protein [Rhodococcus sp. BS-15]
MRKKIMAVVTGIVMAGALSATVGAGSASASVVKMGTFSELRTCVYAGEASGSIYYTCKQEGPNTFVLYADDGITDRVAN